MSEQVHVIALLNAKAGKEDDLTVALENLAQPTRQEAGCIDYGFYRDNSDSSIILSFEVWEHAEAEAAHWETDHLQNKLKEFEELLDTKPVIYKCTKVI